MMFILRLSCFIFMLMFSLIEARRNSIYKQEVILEPNVGPQNENMEAQGIHQTMVFKGIRPNAAHHTKEDGSKKRLNGRKLTSEGGFKKEKANTKKLTNVSANGRSSKISGRNISASRMLNSEVKSEDKKHKEITKKKTWLTNVKKQIGKNSRATSSISFQNLESHELKADNEVWTVMHKDYPGNGGGRRNPPSNNR